MVVLLALAAAASGPLVVDIAGMRPQLNVIRAEAAKNDWTIICTGRSGEEGVLRLHAGQGRPTDSLHSFLDDPSRVGSSEWVDGFGGERLPASCNHNPPVVSGGGATAGVLAAGSHDELRPALRVARQCGYSKAVIRPWLKGDIGGWEPPAAGSWFSLEAGKNASERQGPLVCFMQMWVKVPKTEVAQPW
jgi:hypothetical protein